LADLHGTWPLVGRDDDLDRLARSMRSAMGRGALVVGPAGVGKTRLADECLLLAERDSVRAVRVAATRAAASLPLAPLLPLLPGEFFDGEPGAATVRRAVAAVLEQADGERLVLVVDDAHLLDEASSLVVAALQDDLSVFTILTLRSGEPASDVLMSAWKEARVGRVELAALHRSDTEALLQRVLDGSVDGAVLREAHDATGGNPLYLRELVLGSIRSGHLRDEAGIWRAPGGLHPSPGLAELLAARFAGCSPDEREVLELIASGEPLELSHLEEIAELALVEALEGAALVSVARSDRWPTVRLAHPLYGEVLRHEMGELRWMLVQRRLAESMVSAGSRRPDVVRLALWQLEGGIDPGPELLLDAAKLAFASLDTLLAERLARAAVHAGADDEARMLLAETLVTLGRTGEVEATLTDLAVEDGATARRAAILRAQAAFRGRGDRSLAESALAGAGDQHESVRAQGAVIDLLAGEPARAVTVARPLLDARDASVVALASMAVAPALAVMGHCREAVQVAERGHIAHAEAVRAEGSGDLGLHLAARSLALCEEGLLNEAERAARGGYDVALAAGVDIDRAWHALLLGRSLLTQGRVGRAAHYFREGAAIFSELGHPGLLRWCLGGLMLATATLADANGCRAAHDDLEQIDENPLALMEPDVGRARAWDAAISGDLVRARGLLGLAAEQARDMEASSLEASALGDLLRLSQPGAARDVAPRLCALARRSDSRLIEAHATRAQGLAEGSSVTLETAADLFESCGALLFAAESAAQSAASHRRSGASRAAERCARRARSLASRCEGARTPALALAGPARALTSREREVADLAGAGRSNRAIAEQLGISLRTVENHLHRSFGKLGVEDRADLGSALHDLDRVDPPR
jgi:DNA-binding NarL/FixJ family response regulator